MNRKVRLAAVKGFYMTLDETIYAKLKEQAKRRGLTLQELIRALVAEWLEEKQRKA